MPTNPLLTNRAVVLAKVETTYNQYNAPSSTTDALLIEAPDYQVDVSILERAFARNDLSRLAHRTGRKIARMTFGAEFRSNGLTNSGVEADAARIGRLIRACGFEEIGINTAAEAVQTPIVSETSSAVAQATTWAKAGTLTLTTPRRYKATCVLAGASATAKFRVTSTDQDLETSVLGDETFSALVTSASGTVVVSAVDPLSVTYTIGGTWIAGDIIKITAGGRAFTHTVVSTVVNDIADAVAVLIDADPLMIAANPVAAVVTATFTGTGDGVVVTTGVTALALGNSGLTATPTFSGSFVLGDQFVIDAYPQSIRYKPRSSGFESLTMEMYFDGVKHTMTGAFGSFSLQADAGNYGKVQFTFWGQYSAPTDVALPSPIYEQSLPAQIELASLKLDDFQVAVASFRYDHGGTITPRIDANYSDGYNGVRIVSRNPTGGLDPEAQLVADNDFWSDLSTAKQMRYRMRVGQATGNTIWIWAPSVQYSGLTYQARDQIRTYDAGLNFSRVNGDDEIDFLFR